MPGSRFRIVRFVIGRWIALSIILTLFSVLMTPSAWAQLPPPPVEFSRDIQPIFQQRCLSCHGATQSGGGLRLDDHKSALEGGHSGKPALGGTLDTNELWQRINSEDETYRMPKRGVPLSDSQKQLIKRWIEIGSPWPDPQALQKQRAIQERAKWWSSEEWLNWLERWLTDVPGFIAWLCVMLVLQVVILIIERLKDGERRELAWVQAGWTRCLAHRVRQIGVVHYLLIWLAGCWVMTLLIWRGVDQKQALVARELENYKQQVLRQSQTPTTRALYGDPPIPHRPNHPPTLHPTYYRGNCERSPSLFNGGNYRTATFELELIDSNNQRVEPGQVVPDGTLRLRIGMIRPAGTTKSLYAPNIIDSIFLSEQLFDESDGLVVKPFAKFTTVEPEWKWSAEYAIPVPEATGRSAVSGLLYLYQGKIESGAKGRGTLHYGIRYDLRFEDRRLRDGSELWMGVLFTPPVVETPQPGKLPLREWFGHEPIPIVTGENSTDPKLLGIPEHEEKLKKLNAPEPDKE